MKEDLDNQNINLHDDSFKKTLSKHQKNQRNLITSCLILLGVLQGAIKHMNDLKEKCNTMNKIINVGNDQNWLRLIIKNLVDVDNKILDQKFDDHLNINNEMVEAIDYSICSSVFSSTNSFNDDKSDMMMMMMHRNRPLRHSTTKLSLLKGLSKICLFRKAVIAVLAVHRFTSLISQKKNINNYKTLNVYDSCCRSNKKFVFFTQNNDDLCAEITSSLMNRNEMFDKLQNITEELIQSIDSLKNDNLIVKVKETVLKAYSLMDHHEEFKKYFDFFVIFLKLLKFYLLIFVK
jgi:hypothetical protein